MTTAARTTKGITIGIGDGGSPTETFDVIGEVTNFQAPGISNDQIEVTHLGSTAKEYIAGLSDGDECTFDVNYIAADAQQQALWTLAQSGAKNNFQIDLNDHATTPSTITFAAIVTKMPGVSGGVNEAQKRTGITLKVSGTPTHTFAP